MVRSFRHDNWLVERLKAIQPFLYFPSSGNAGDALISHATFEFFRRHQIDYQLFTEQRYLACRRVVIGGGGGFVDGYRKMAELIHRLKRDVEAVIILPSSAFGYESVIRSMDSRFHFMARESVTLSHVLKHASGAVVDYCQDMAFSLDLSSLCILERLPILLRAQPLHYQMKWLMKYRLLSMLMNPCSEQTLFLRGDRESKQNLVNIAMAHLDLSHLIKGKMDREDRAAAMSQLFCSIIAQQHSVVTDRLHIAIACGLIGVSCLMLANNYHKNQAIYEESIKIAFPCVAFSESYR